MHNLRICSCHIDTELLQNKFPDTPPEACAACVARLVYYRYINPAIMYVHLHFPAVARLTPSSAHQRRSTSCQQQLTSLHARTSRRSRRCWPRSPAARSLATRALRIYPSTTMFGRASLRLLLGFCKVCFQERLRLCLRLLTTVAVADVSDAETEFHAHEFLDATIQPRPIWISPNEVYSMHTLLSQQLDHLVCSIVLCTCLRI